MKTSLVKIAIIFIFIVSSFTSQAQQCAWVRTATAADPIHGFNSDIQTLAMKKDSKGYIYLTGYIDAEYGTTHFDNFSITCDVSPVPRLLVLKYTPNGQLVWGKTLYYLAPAIGGMSTGSAAGVQLLIDNSDNIIVLGIFHSSDIILGNDTLYNNGVINNVNTNIFAWKMNENGNHIWSMQSKRTDIGAVSLNKAIFDEQGNIYITGGFAGMYAVLGADTIWNNNFATWDLCIIKINANGSFAWARRQGGPGREGGNSLVVENGYIYSTGFIYDCPYTIFNNDTLYGRTFLVKYDTYGNFIWVKVKEKLEYSSIISSKNNDFFLSGIYFNGATIGNNTFQTVNPNNNYVFSPFISRIDTSGNFIWAKKSGIGDAGNTNLSLDNYGRLWAIFGYRDSSLIFGNDTFKYTPDIHPVNIGWDAALVCFDTSTCNKLFGFNISGNGFDIINNYIIKKDTAYVTGAYSSDMLKIGDTTVYATTINSNDWYFAKYILPPLGINDTPPTTSLSIHPNPFTQQFVVTKTQAQQAELLLYDGLGKLVLRKKIMESTTNIDTDDLPNGLYFYTFINAKGERIQAGKLMKE